MNETTPSPLGDVITIDDERIKNHLDRVARGSVEETLNALLDAEADRLCNAQRRLNEGLPRSPQPLHFVCTKRLYGRSCTTTLYLIACFTNSLDGDDQN